MNIYKNMLFYRLDIESQESNIPWVCFQARLNSIRFPLHVGVWLDVLQIHMRLEQVYFSCAKSSRPYVADI